MFTVEYATNPVFGNAEGTCVVLQVKFREFNEVLPFGATSYDSMPHGVDIYNRAIAGEFGPIAPFVHEEVQPTSVGAQTL